MNDITPKTTALLKSLGLNDFDIAGIHSGEITWDIVDHNDGSFLLLLFNNEGGQKGVAFISEDKMKELLNVSEFERREAEVDYRSPSFPVGDVNDWAGIKPDADWLDLVKSYREAVEALAQKPTNANAAPYLFLCRHTIELQLKAIIMLGQEAMKLTAFLPSHHDLDRLWSAAFPVIKLYPPKEESQIDQVRQIVKDYHDADPGSFNFRYPVSTNNKPIKHASFVHSFGVSQHSLSFRNACNCLDKVIQRLRFALIFIQFGTSKQTNEDKKNV